MESDPYIHQEFEAAWRELAPYDRSILLFLLHGYIELSKVGMNNASLAPGKEDELTLARWTDRKIPRPVPGYSNQILYHQLVLTDETRAFLEIKNYSLDDEAL
jgi:hypothetical protein